MLCQGKVDVTCKKKVGGRLPRSDPREAPRQLPRLTSPRMSVPSGGRQTAERLQRAGANRGRGWEASVPESTLPKELVHIYIYIPILFPHIIKSVFQCLSLSSICVSAFFFLSSPSLSSFLCVSLWDTFPPSLSANDQMPLMRERSSSSCRHPFPSTCAGIRISRQDLGLACGQGHFALRMTGTEPQI